MKRRVLTAIAIFCAVIMGAVIGSRLPVLAQSALIPGPLGGGYRVSLIPATPSTGPASAPIPFVVMLTSDGGAIGTVAPLSCLSPGSSIGAAVGSWTLSYMSKGLRMQYQMVGPIYQNGQEIGELQINGMAPLPTNGSVTGSANVLIPPSAEPNCSYLNGAASFTGTRIPPIPPEVTAN